MANSAVIGLLRVLLSADSAQFKTEMKAASRAADEWSRNLRSVGRQVQDFGLAVTKFMAPIGAAMAASAKAAIDFESSFAGVRKTVNASEPEFQKLAASFRALSKQIPINVNELNKIGEAAGQLGIKKENIVGFTEVMAKLGVTTNLSADEAATALARLANITQMPQSNFDRLGSTIVDLGNNFATTEAEIVEFGLRIAGAGKIAGLTEDQILAIGTAMSSVGVQAEAGGTAVQKVLNDMTEAVATGNDALAVFAATAGMSAQQFADAFRKDAGAAFAAFVNGLGTQGDQAFQTLNDLKLGNERVIRAFLSLANAGDLVNRTLEVGATAWRENSALTEEARKRFETTESKLTVLWNRIKDVGITLGNALLPSINAAIGLADKLIPIIEGLATGFAALPAPVQATVTGLGLMAVAAGPMLILAGNLTRSIGDLIVVFGRKGVAAKALAGSLDLATAAMARFRTGAMALRGVLLGPAGLVAALGGAAIAFTLFKGAQIREEADQIFEASRIIGKGVRDLAEARDILDAYQKGLSGQSLDMTKRNTLEMAAAWQKGAEEAGRLGGALEFLGKQLTIVTGEGEGGGGGVVPALNNQADALERAADAAAAYLAALGPLPTLNWDLARALADVAVSRMDLPAPVAPSIGATPGLPGFVGENVGIPGIPKLPSIFKGLGNLASTQLGPTIMNALMGGGSVVKSVGGLFGGALGSNIAGNLAKTLTGTFGKTLGGALGSVIPGLGTMLGSLGGSLIGKLFGGGQGRQTVEEFAKSMGGFDALREKLNTLGAEGERLWKNLTQGVGRNNPEQARAAIAAIEGALMKSEERTAGFNQKLGSLLGRLRDVGAGLPEPLAAYLRDLEKAGSLTEANIGLMHELLSQGEADWRKVSEAVERYGGDITKLGGSFQEARLHDSWQQLIDDIDLFERANISANDILDLTKGKIIDLVQQSMRFGTEIPENMRPWIQELIKSGELVDENGEKITDIGNLKFGETLQTSIQSLRDAVKELIDEFRKIPGVVAAIPGRVETTVAVRRQVEPGDPEIEGPARAFAHGTNGYEYFHPRGEWVKLHGWEKVTPLGAERTHRETGTTVAQIFLEGRQIAEAVIPHMPGVRRRYGLA